MDMQDIFILNCLDKNVHAVAFGNHFNLKPKQIKRFRGEIGQFLDGTKGYLGLIAVSDAFEDPQYITTDEGKSELESKTKEGINRRAQYLMSIVNNLQTSLRGDMDAADIKASTESQATAGELEAMDELLSYQRKQEDESKLRAEAVRVRLRQVNAAQNSLVNKPKE
jgi:hypothetical protein